LISFTPRHTRNARSETRSSRRASAGGDLHRLEPLGKGFAEDELCGLFGSYIPFALTPVIRPRFLIPS
jgi:hypothetical protein